MGSRNVADAFGQTAYWGPLNEPVCNRSIGWDIGLVGAGIVTNRLANHVARTAGNWATGLMGQARNVSRAARAVSVVGLVSIAAEIGLIYGDSHYC